MARYYSIRKASQEPDIQIAECALRRMTKEGRCPGFYSGAKFLVDVDELAVTLKARSRASVTAEGVSFGV